jgi:hypothetical protein
VFVLAAGWGVHSAVAQEDSATQWIISVGLAVACAIWCAADASARGLTLVWPARIGIFFFWPVAVPIYLIWSRGVRGVLTAFVAIVAWVIVVIATFTLSGYLAYGPAWFGRPQ